MKEGATDNSQGNANIVLMCHGVLLRLHVAYLVAFLCVCVVVFVPGWKRERFL